MNADENTGDSLNESEAVPHYENAEGGDLAMELCGEDVILGDKEGHTELAGFEVTGKKLLSGDFCLSPCKKG